MTVIKIFGLADGVPTVYDGEYIKDVVFDVNKLGRIRLTTTQLRDEALQFKSGGEAFEFWKRQSKVCPRRPDGKPNRPLTAFTVEIGENI